MTTTFPTQNLGIKVELLLNAVWTDISVYVYQRSDIQITGQGRGDWTSGMQAAQMTLTLNNRDGRFTPKLAAGAYYPYITRNVRIRVSVDSQSTTSVVYTGYRFYGEVSAWPVKWDETGKDIYVDVSAAGIWLRLSQSKQTLGSPYLRYITKTLTGSDVPRYYLPMEDGSGSLNFVTLTTGASNATFTGAPSFASDGAFKGSDAIPTLNQSVITANIPAGGTPTNNCIRFLLDVPAGGDSNSDGGNWDIIEVDTASVAVPILEVYLSDLAASKGKLIFAGRTVSTQRWSVTTTTDVRGIPLLVSIELTPSGGNIAWALRLIKPGDGSILESKTGTYNTASIGAISKVIFGRASQLNDTAVGHLQVGYTVPSLVTAAQLPLNGYSGELAMTRFTRLCTEYGIASETIGNAADTEAMGPQMDKTLTDLLEEIERTDQGMLYESRAAFAIGYRNNKSMLDQAAAATFNYATATLVGPLDPVYDYQLTRNNITVTNWNGYIQQAMLTAGAMSVLDPPNGIGSGYEDTKECNVASDSQVAGIANFWLNLGTVDEVRVPSVSLDMSRPEVVALFAAVPGLRPGDYLQVTNPLSMFSASSLALLSWGYSETLNARKWQFTFNTVPRSPWVTGFTPGTVQLHQNPGGTSVSSQGDFVKSVAALLQNGNISAGMLNSGITAFTLGGIRTTIAVSGPIDPQPNEGDIWINSATGQQSRYDGANWTPLTFDADSVINAGTIVGSLISGGTITAGLLAAGIAVVGIVDATEVNALRYNATSSGGQFFAYDTDPPSTGHLLNAIAGAAGTDPVANPFPKGFLGQGLTLVSQSSAPPAFSGAGIVYMSTQGRLRYKDQVGNDLVLDRSVLDLTNVSMGTQTTPIRMSSILNYVANEAQVGSEYELEIDGTLTTPTSAVGTEQTFTWSIYLDGAPFSSSVDVTAGAVMLVRAQTFAYCMRFRATVDVTGGSGHVTIACDGGLTRKGANMGNTQTNGGLMTSSAQNVAVNQAFDSTSNHSLAVYCAWGGGTAASGHSAITYRTKKTRRN